LSQTINRLIFPAPNSTSHKLSVKNLQNPYLRKRDWYA
jgi:hypothetical protein